MSDNLFPSGPWRGFYTYRPGDKHSMELNLTFAHGVVRGMGRDDIGAFRIKGSYDPATEECSWIKTYLDAHDVAYRGYREGKGIWGLWQIGKKSRGGFHIWPRSVEEEAADGTANASEPKKTVEPLTPRDRHLRKNRPARRSVSGTKKASKPKTGSKPKTSSKPKTKKTKGRPRSSGSSQTEE